MDKPLVIIITGGGSGIGAALTKSLSNDGHKIVICGRRRANLEETAGASGNIACFECDVSNEENVAAFHDFVKSKFSHVDVLINCAGTFGAIGRFDKTDSKMWKNTFEINTFGTYLTTKHFLELILHSDTKKIINFSGGGAFSPFKNYGAYAVSKAGVVRFSENLAVELEGEGVQVNCIAPGFVSTELHNTTLEAGNELAGKHHEITLEKLKNGPVSIDVPVNCVKFLISHESDGLTGKTISASFDKWDTDAFKASIKEISTSDLYTLRRINLINLDKESNLRNKLIEAQDRC